VQLRPHQEQFLSDVRGAFRAGHRRVLGTAPTGMGKTLCGATMTRGAVANGNRVLFAAGRRELIRQTVATFARCAGIDLTDTTSLSEVVEALANTATPVRVIQAANDLGPTDAPVIVGSVQTLSAPRWLGALAPVQFGILDEAHHGSAATWSDLVKSQPDARWVGLSATPERGDGKPLDLFDVLVPGPSVRQLTELGYLVPCRTWAGPATLKPGELAMTPLEAYQRFAAGQRAAVFCRDRAHARAELAVFQAAGIQSAVITGDMPDRARDAALAAWRSGDVLAALSVNVLTEGFDMPELGVAILARRFNHVGAYLQAGGRIVRAAPGKSQATLIDLTGCAHEHGPLEADREFYLTGKAIRPAAARDGFGQCRACGTMFLYGPRACAECGAEIPTRPAVAPRSVGVGVAELGTARPRTPWVSTLPAKRDGFCRKCGRWFPKGTPIFFTQGEAGSARHQICPAPALMSAVGDAP
jgi:DNA repair protein RadD